MDDDLIDVDIGSTAWVESKQGDITAAFVHTDVEKDGNIYVEMPHGFRKQGKVLKLKNTLYGLQ